MLELSKQYEWNTQILTKHKNKQQHFIDAKAYQKNCYRSQPGSLISLVGVDHYWWLPKAKPFPPQSGQDQRPPSSFYVYFHFFLSSIIVFPRNAKFSQTSDQDTYCFLQIGILLRGFYRYSIARLSGNDVIQRKRFFTIYNNMIAPHVVFSSIKCKEFLRYIVIYI